MTSEGKERVEGIVITADQWCELNVSRGQVFKPGMVQHGWFVWTTHK